MKRGELYIMECCQCGGTWEDFLGAYGAAFQYGCPHHCGSLYWRVTKKVEQ